MNAELKLMKEARAANREFYYADNLERLREICKRDRMSKNQSRDFHLAWEIQFPALLEFAGFPLVRNQQCWAHEGGTGTSLSFYPRAKDGRWIFHCNNPKCRITGDQSELWFQVVERARLQPASWCLPQACADLLARVESGEIDVSIDEFEGTSAKTRGHAAPHADEHWEKLSHLIAQNKEREIEGCMRLPKPVRLSVKQVILRLFPENRFLMISSKRNWHDIKRRNEWLTSREKPPVCERSFISSNYLSRDDANCSYQGMEGIERRWLVIEGDKGSLEEQFWIHQQLAKQHQLCCLCYSGGKSIHGWYLVEGMSERKCFDLWKRFA